MKGCSSGNGERRQAEATLVLDVEGRLLDADSAAERAFGHERETLLGSELEELVIAARHRERWRNALAGALPGASTDVEVAGVRGDGVELPMLLTITPVQCTRPACFVVRVKLGGHSQYGAQAIGALLERERTGRELAELQEQRLRRLVAQVLGAEERERRRLARAVHDGPLQELAAADLALCLADRRPESIASARQAIGHAIAQLRDAVFDLYPRDLEQLGLEAVARDLMDTVSERSGLDFSCEIATAATGAHERLMFSLLRELVTNVERHAQASRVDVSVRHEAEQLTLCVADDGRGLPVTRLDEAIREGHIGLASCIERVEALGGTMQISAAAGAGTVITATVPARRAADRDPLAALLGPGDSVPGRGRGRERRSVAL